MISRSSAFSYQSGVTLVELAIVLVIISLLTVGGLKTFQNQREQVRYSDSQQYLDQIKQALLSFASVNLYLPCPDSDADGNENRAGNGTCSAVEGGVPFLDIGLRQAEVKDGFGADILYRVNAQTSNLAAMQDNAQSASYFCNSTCTAGTLPQFDLNTPPVAANNGVGNGQVCAKAQANCTNASVMTYDAASVVLVAANQKGALSCNNRPAEEQENCDGDALFWQGDFRAVSSGFFDDTVLGVTGYEIKQNLLNARPAIFD